MRRLYLLSDHEFAEDFEGMGLDPESDALDPPTCPRCGRELLVGYQEDGEVYIVYDEVLEPGECLAAEAWFLLCGNFECPYEEPVERVFRPAGALIYDLRTALWDFGEATGFFHSEPRVIRELLEYLQNCHGRSPSRKLAAHMAELQFQYEYALQERREWLAGLIPGQRVELTTAAGRVAGPLLAAGADAITVAGRDGAVLVPLERVQRFGAGEAGAGPAPPVILSPDRERIVVRGHHLAVEEVDRFGRFHASTMAPHAGRDLQMEDLGELGYMGVFLPREVEARYELLHLVRVQGYWLEVMGATADEQFVAVCTWDPVAAAALSLGPRRGDGLPGSAAVAGWQGLILRRRVEAEEVHRLHIWPIPEVSRRADK